VLIRITVDHLASEKNKAERTRFWSVLGRTVNDVIGNALRVAFIRSATEAGIPSTPARKNRGFQRTLAARAHATPTRKPSLCTRFLIHMMNKLMNE
jgi:hypothetical protein